MKGSIDSENHGKTEWGECLAGLIKKEDWNALLDWCKKWTKSEPENALAWHNLGIAYAKLKRYDDAINAYREAVRLNPDKFYIWVDLGNTYKHLKRYDDAVNAYREAVRINPEHTSTWCFSEALTAASNGTGKPSKPTAKSSALIRSIRLLGVV